MVNPIQEELDSAQTQDANAAPLFTSKFVTVQGNVVINYLDYNEKDTNKPLLAFLHGLGDNAHVYDEFAPLFIDKYHVIAISRRGFGESSQDLGDYPFGYEIDSLVQDLLEVVDSITPNIPVTLAGHSIAGCELTRFAVLHPDRLEKLIYLDSAYDYNREDKNVNKEYAWLDSLYSPKVFEALEAPQPTSHDLSSLPKLTKFFMKTYPLTYGKVHIASHYYLSQLYAFNIQGHAIGFRTPDKFIEAEADCAFQYEIQWDQVTVPALILFPGNRRSLAVDYPWLNEPLASDETSHEEEGASDSTEADDSSISLPLTYGFNTNASLKMKLRSARGSATNPIHEPGVPAPKPNIKAEARDYVERSAVLGTCISTMDATHFYQEAKNPHPYWWQIIDGSHYLFISNCDETSDLMKEFLSNKWDK